MQTRLETAYKQMSITKALANVTWTGRH